MKPDAATYERIAAIRDRYTEQAEEVIAKLYEIRDSYITEVRLEIGQAPDNIYMDSFELSAAIEAMLTFVTPGKTSSICGEYQQFAGIYNSRDCKQIQAATEWYAAKSKNVILRAKIGKIADRRKNSSRKGVPIEGRRRSPNE